MTLHSRWIGRWERRLAVVRESSSPKLRGDHHKEVAGSAHIECLGRCNLVGIGRLCCCYSRLSELMRRTREGLEKKWQGREGKGGWRRDVGDASL